MYVLQVCTKRSEIYLSKYFPNVCIMDIVLDWEQLPMCNNDGVLEIRFCRENKEHKFEKNINIKNTLINYPQ